MKDSIIYPLFPMRTVPLGNQIVDKGKHLCINLLQLINKNKMTESELHCFAAPNELMERH